ncbi:methylation site containing protein [Shewanella mangrovi]|uniref:Type II secretion system protein H n=1 Tax=Shewanella mangrovi TaxID=1515746 RepID=A0A094K3F3_9GAMM|nr:GspH/FimT family pseudopilin [Shewanella mangrovi]KFZ39231.1 methylation site containing protein [Shewanella mangrovi]
MPRFQSAFTLVELMVTIAVAAILLTVGVPSLKSLYDGYRGSSSISEIQQTLAFARNQAISYGRPVGVCANSSNTSCGSDWSNGVLVYATTAGSTDTVNQVLKVIDSFNSNDSVKGSKIVFRADGIANGSASFVYCPNGETTASRSVSVSSSGLISEGADNQSCSG